MTRAGKALLGVVLVGLLAGCVGAVAPPSATEKSRITVGLVGEFAGGNARSVDGGTSVDDQVARLTSAAFSRVGEDGRGHSVDDFGLVEKVGDDPLRVRYTVKPGVVWSDGVPVNAADLLLAWAAASGALDTVTPERDESGRVTNQEAINDGVYFGARDDDAAAGLRLVTSVPKVSEDGRAVTLTFSHDYSDWLSVFPPQLIPAHVVLQHAVPAKDYTVEKAKAVLIRAIQSNDAAVLGPVSTFWSHGFDVAGFASDPSLRVSSGPYVVASVDGDRSVTLRANDRFRWGPMPRFQTIVLSLHADDTELVQAVESGRVDLVSVPATVDNRHALDAVGDLRTRMQATTAREHLDLTVNNRGPFDPHRYLTHAKRALAVREAFLLTVPREEILHADSTPVADDAVVPAAATVPSFAADYARVAAGNGSEAYADTDVSRAAELLAGAKVATPVTVRLLYPKGDRVRTAQFEAIRSSAAKAGFDVVDASSDHWHEVLGDGSYDAALFAWDSSGTTVAFTESVYGTSGSRNLNGYSSPIVDSLLARMASDDGTQRLADTVALEKQLYDDAYGLPLYEPAVVTAYDPTVVRKVRINPYDGLLAGYASWAPQAKAVAGRDLD